jgi:hypothetical protein
MLRSFKYFEKNKEKEMIEVLNFIFRDFWTFIGSLFLLYAIGEIVKNVTIIKIVKKEKEEV